MSGFRTYHLLEAVISPPAFDPKRLFAWSVHRMVNGFVDHHDYVQLATRVHAQPPAWSRLERQIGDLIRMDINPVSEMFQEAVSTPALLQRWNGFNRFAQLGVQTIASLEPEFGVLRQEHGSAAVSSFRTDVTTLCLETLLRSAHSDGKRAYRPFPLLALFDALGVNNPTIEDAIQHIYDHPANGLADCAIALCTTKRTLQRNLSDHALSFRMLRQAVRLSIASGAIRKDANSLTDIAIDAGFFDSAHFVHAWKQSCGLSPSRYRELVLESSAR